MVGSKLLLLKQGGFHGYPHFCHLIHKFPCLSWEFKYDNMFHV